MDRQSVAKEKLNKTNEMWEVLKSESGAHEIIVSAYRDCRVSGRSSIAQCHLVAKDYAELKGVSLRFPEVLAEIEVTSQRISSKI